MAKLSFGRRMFPPLIITLRETLEASLVVGIVLAFLHRTENQKYDYCVWLGVVGGIAVSAVLAWVFSLFVGGFTGQAEYLYEGITMLTAAALITWMIVWMAGQGRHMRENIEKKVAMDLRTHSLVGIALLTFVSVLREGIETILFLHAAFLQSQSAYHHIGAILGIVIAVGAAFLFFKTMSGTSVRHFFRATTVLLLLFAAGLVAHGIHELQEAAVIPIITEHIWNTNAILDENGTVGSLLKGVFGYNGNPSLIEVMGYSAYIVLMGWWFKRSQMT